MFPLIWFGGLTTSHGAGLAVPDWPNTYGYNMFAVPFSVWLSESAGGIFFEHTHRLLGALTGLFAVAATLWAWGIGQRERVRRWMGGATLALSVLATASVLLVLTGAGADDRLFGHAASGFGGAAVVCLLAWLARTREPRPWVRWGTIAMLGAIIIQGVLGGLRVTEVNLELAMVHGVFAQVTFCLAGTLTLATSQWWTAVDAEPQGCRYAYASRPWLAPAVLTSLVFAQLLIAAVMRHYQAGLAVPDFPLSYGQVMPPVSQAGLDRANEVRAFDLSLPPTTLGQIWLHSAHRIGALVITVAYCWLLRQVVRWPRDMRPARHVTLLSLLLAAQISLGVATVWMGKPADVATAHVATGALLLLASWLLFVRLLRVSRRSQSHQSLPAGAALTKFRNPWRRRPRQTARPGALVPTSA